MYKFAVIGYPISHSKSPEIHRLFAKQTNLQVIYNKVQVSRELLSNHIDNLIESGYEGVNVTVPLKEDMFALALSRKYLISGRAFEAKCANTVGIKEGKLFIDNTDGIGFIKSMEKSIRNNITKKNLLIIGAGGVTKGILGPLIDLSPKSITLANRSFQRLGDIKNQFNGSKISFVSLRELKMKETFRIESVVQGFDIIVNATSGSMDSDEALIDPKFFETSEVAIDLFYSKKLTTFLEKASKAGCPKVFDGFSMLVEQAAESFFLWTGLRPNTEELKENREIFFK
jgi:shikimate dehydrogenase